jgi:hypothetical protein
MSWRNVLICGVVASAAAVGCKVTVNDCSNGGCPDAGFFGNGGSGEQDSSTGGTRSTGGTSGSGGSSKGGTSGAGGSSSKGGTSSGGATGGGTLDAGHDAGPGSCQPEQDPPKSCAQCIDTKCCQEWLDCVDDKDCSETVAGKKAEFGCIQGCLVDVDSGIMTLDECAGKCQHDTVGVSSATSALIACTRNTGDSGTAQNCTQECFLRDLP